MESKCYACRNGDELKTCPCGNEFCELHEGSIYSDENSCLKCDREKRKEWDKCGRRRGGHQFEGQRPYENEHLQYIVECKNCSYPLQLENPSE